MALSDQQKARVVTLFKDGRPVKEIAAEFGVTTSGIYYVLEQAGARTPTRKRAPAKKKERKQHSTAEKVQILVDDMAQADARWRTAIEDTADTLESEAAFLRDLLSE